jgi:hypothetical protein
MARRILFVTDSVGGLGNQLFRYAHVAAHAQHTGATLVYPGFTHAAAFPALRDDALCRHPPPQLPVPARMRPLAVSLARAGGRLARRAGVHAQGGEVDLGRLDRHGRVTMLSGWGLRDSEALGAHAARIREFLALDPGHVARGRAAVEAARRRAYLIIGLHVRQGDYREWQGGRWFFEDEVYAELMRSAIEGFAGTDVAFLVCASESRARPAFAGLPVHDGPGDQYGDLAALAACDRILGPPSTFSSWAAFSGDVPYGYVLQAGTAVTPATFARWSAA